MQIFIQIFSLFNLVLYFLHFFECLGIIMSIFFKIAIISIILCVVLLVASKCVYSFFSSIDLVRLKLGCNLSSGGEKLSIVLFLILCFAMICGLVSVVTAIIGVIQL